MGGQHVGQSSVDRRLGRVCVLDPKHTFDSLMLYGNELSLILFELLLICTVDRQTVSFVADAIITYVVMEVSKSIKS